MRTCIWTSFANLTLVHYYNRSYRPHPLTGARRRVRVSGGSSVGFFICIHFTVATALWGVACTVVRVVVFYSILVEAVDLLRNNSHLSRYLLHFHLILRLHNPIPALTFCIFISPSMQSFDCGDNSVPELSLRKLVFDGGTKNAFATCLRSNSYVFFWLSRSDEIKQVEHYDACFWFVRCRSPGLGMPRQINSI